MPSIKTTILATAVFLASTASSQRNYNIDPESVPISTRETWCTTQKATCPILCLQDEDQSLTTIANDCDATTLSFDCICGNGISPNASEYSETIPFYKCRQYGEYCVQSCGGNSDCAYNCRADNPCGAQNPRRVNITSTSSSAVASATGNPSNVVYDGFGGQTTPTAAAGSSGTGAKSAGMMAVDLGKSYGLAVVLSGVFAGFALIL